KARVGWLGLLGAMRLERETISGADGRYRIDDLPVPTPSSPLFVRAGADAEGYAPVQVCIDLSGLVDAREQDFVLVRGARVTGRVIDGTTEAPIAHARVALWCRALLGRSEWQGDPTVPEPFTTWGTQETSADPDGRFALVQVPARSVHAPVSDRNPLGHVGAVADGYAPNAEELPLAGDGATLEVTI